MKKFLLLLALIPFFGFSQDQAHINDLNNIIELQNQKINKLEKDVVDLKLHMNSHHSQFKMGMMTSVAGAVATIIDPSFAIFGGVLSVVGSILVWDSDKFFGLKYTNNKRRDRTNKNLISVCDCKHVFNDNKSVKSNIAFDTDLIKKCKKLARSYNVNTELGLQEWQDAAEKGGCLD